MLKNRIGTKMQIQKTKQNAKIQQNSYILIKLNYM